MMRRIITAVPVVRTPGGSVRIKDNEDPVLVEKSPTSRRLKTWRPANTPVLGTPERRASPAPGPSRPRRRLVDSEIEELLNDSGSDSDFVSDDDEDAADPGVTVQEAARRLRELAMEEEEEEFESNIGGAGGNGGREDAAAENLEGAGGDGGRVEGVGGDGGRADAAAENVGGAGGDGDRVAGNPDLNNFTWSANFDEFAGQEEVFTREPGPTTRSTDPMELFLLIWDVTVLGRIVDQTNLYAWQVISALSEIGDIPKYLDRWVETTVAEIRRLFAIIMLMSLDPRPRVDDYWATGVLHMPAFRKLMSRNRFQLLMRFLHFTNNYEMAFNLTSYEKKINKIKELFDYIIGKFSELYVPRRELALDETLLLWKGRLSWVQCIRSKAARFGIKSFELCESSTGYLLRSILYAGKNSSFVEGPIHGFSNKTSKVVLELLDGYLDVGHVVVMDNWYNQLPLTRFLKFRKTDVLGTLNKNRLFVPNEIKTVNPKRLVRGQQVARHCGDIAVIAWKDVKLVTVLSTYHNDEQVVGRRGGQQLMKPVAIESYNRAMGGVDLKDMKLSNYPMERKRGRKWYVKVFMRLLNTSVMNAYVLYAHNKALNVLEHRQFRLALVTSLIESSQPEQVPRDLVLGLGMTRLDDQPGHHPINTEMGRQGRHQRRRCKRCSAQGRRTEVAIMCVKCQAPLCIGQCWIDYHTLEIL